MTNAKRHNEGKPELHYLDTWFHALCEVAQVCQDGSKKYSRGNYLLGQDYSQLLSAAGRHQGKFGNHQLPDRDAETGRHHIAHAIWNLLQLLQLEVGPDLKHDGRSNREVFDNRLKPDTPEQRSLTRFIDVLTDEEKDYAETV